MKKFLILYSVVLLVFGFAGSALAIPVTFDFTGGGNTLVNNETFTGSDGLTTVFADESPADRDLFLGQDGLGVYGGGNDSAENNLPGTQVDGYGTNEGIIFTFITAVRLTSVSFDWVGDNDDFALYVGDGAGGFNLIDGDIDIPGGETYNFSGSWISNQFIIAALGENDDFLVSGMEVYTQNPVPEPATMLLLGTGLLGVVGAGRKKIFKSSQ